MDAVICPKLSLRAGTNNLGVECDGVEGLECKDIGHEIPGKFERLEYFEAATKIGGWLLRMQ